MPAMLETTQISICGVELEINALLLSMTDAEENRMERTTFLLSSAESSQLLKPSHLLMVEFKLELNCRRGIGFGRQFG
jgi:hypothetical protein